MLILTETGVEEGAVLTEKLRTLVQRQRFPVEGRHDISVTISIGIAGGVGQQLRMEALVRDADAAMYSAKSLGRNQTYIFAEPDDDARVPRAPISAAGRARADRDRAAGARRRDGRPDLGARAPPPLPRPAVAAHRLDRRRAGAPAAAARGRDRPAARRGAPPRRRQGRRAGGDPREAVGADLGRVADRRPAPAHRPGHPRAGGRAQGRGADHPPPPRALRRPRLPVRPARQRDPARRAHRGHRRRLRRDGPRPAVQARDVARGRRSPSCAGTPARSSTPSSSSSSATCTRRQAPEPDATDASRSTPRATAHAAPAHWSRRASERRRPIAAAPPERRCARPMSRGRRRRPTRTLTRCRAREAPRPAAAPARRRPAARWRPLRLVPPTARSSPTGAGQCRRDRPARIVGADAARGSDDASPSQARCAWQISGRPSKSRRTRPGVAADPLEPSDACVAVGPSARRPSVQPRARPSDA